MRTRSEKGRTSSKRAVAAPTRTSQNNTRRSRQATRAHRPSSTARAPWYGKANNWPCPVKCGATRVISGLEAVKCTPIASGATAVTPM